MSARSWKVATGSQYSPMVLRTDGRSTLGGSIVSPVREWTSCSLVGLASIGVDTVRLDHLPPVPRRVAETGVDVAVAADGLLGELDAEGTHAIVGGAAVVHAQH